MITLVNRNSILVRENHTIKLWVQKYWASNSGKDCFALYARRLQITGSDDNSCWIWDQDQDQETEDRKVEVAESVKVRWLEARTRFSTVNLQQSATYNVYFVVKVKEQKMLNVPLNVKLVLPDGSKQETQRSVSSLDKWERLLVGTFRTAYNTIGMLDISLQQVDDKWKERIVIKCVEIVAQD
ncbi:uncharacterized protein PHLOEM PROTEIN 2-LIKE A4-like isoform X2 [Punica granatum]|uniref:Uncharacterized protein PHLOEM PROTEIN 2-LIKE A4-like isoform X2 n=1 Tax=Punica granatum TaxID=22663 RepID=A0A6P8D3Y5_PUNGR|nr:uncharacterized protein PHLOEM PROTEIN 2-LIKE A4-like isoform X2 [Punica granatum]